MSRLCRGPSGGTRALIPDSTPEQRPDFALLGYAISSMELATYHSAQDILLGTSPTELARWETSLDRLVTPSAPPMFSGTPPKMPTSRPNTRTGSLAGQAEQWTTPGRGLVSGGCGVMKEPARAGDSTGYRA